GGGGRVRGRLRRRRPWGRARCADHRGRRRERCAGESWRAGRCSGDLPARRSLDPSCSRCRRRYGRRSRRNAVRHCVPSDYSRASQVMSTSRRVVLALPLVLAATNAGADSYPTHPIRFLVPWPAGGVADTVARVVAAKRPERLGQRLVVENRPGASGNIGMTAAAAAPADGYTLVLTPTGNLTVNQTLYKDLPFDTDRDFLPLTMLATVPNVLV